MSGFKTSGDVLLDYDVTLDYLKEEDRVFYFESTNSNYSLAGVEIQLRRHKAKYILQYYCTSGLFVVVSWVMKINNVICWFLFIILCLSSMFILYVNLICLSDRSAFWFPRMLFQGAWPFWSPFFLYSLVSLTTFGQHRLRLPDSVLYRLGFFRACFLFLGLFWDMQEYCLTSISYQRYCTKYIVLIGNTCHLLPFKWSIGLICV